MTKVATQTYAETVLEVEEPASSGTFITLCGIYGVDVDRTANIDSEEVGDCDDESLPFTMENEVRSLEMSASGEGHWANTSNSFMNLWWRSGATKNVRLRNAKAEADGATGDIINEAGPAILEKLGNAREKGKKTTAAISIKWDGLPAAGLKA